MGFYSGLSAEKYDRQYSDRDLVRRIAKYFKPFTKQIILISFMIVLMAFMGAGIPIIVSRGIDVSLSVENTTRILLISGAVLLIGILQWLANYVRRRMTMRTIANVLTDMSESAFSAAAEHDLSFYDQFSSGRIVSRITSDTREFGQLVSLITDLLSQITQSIILAVVLINIDLVLSLYLFALVPFIFVVTITFRRLARKVTREGMRAMATVNATIKESISGISVAKNFRQENSIFQNFDQANFSSYKVNLRRGFILTLIWPTMNAIGGTMTALLVYFGGLSAIQGIVTAGAWFLFILSMDRFMFPVMNLSSFWTQVQTGLAAAERVFALMDATHAVAQTGNIAPPELHGKIVFEEVDFHYKENEPVLEDFNLDISPGENIAFVGHTGAGKSSIIKLIARFYEFQRGRVSIDGLDIRSMDLTAYRRQLGIVSQVPFLFSETVIDNIRYGRPEISDEEVLSTAKKIGNGEWLDALPEGLDTKTGERGALLSMGQRQLVALMRVLVQKPAIFILDEATASVDPFTEWQIQQALNLILDQSTSILIAHRLSTIRSADRIIVLESGKIIEQGNHESLLKNKGNYANLYNTFFRHQSLEYIEQSRSLAEAGRI